MFTVAQARILALIAMVGVVPVACAPPSEADPDASVDPGPMVLETDPQQGEKDVPIDKVVRIYMSDHVDGDSVRRDAFSLKTGGLSYWLMAFYDPVRGRLTVWPSAEMRQGAQFVFSLQEGLRGLDGGPVAPGEVTAFTTGFEAGDNHPYDQLALEGALEVMFAQRCGSCHGGDEPIAGLDLEDIDGFLETAVDRDADGLSGWKRIVPYKPGSSYLLYKLIGDPRTKGEPMPRSFESDEPARQLEREQLEAVSDWIAGGAAFFDQGDGAK